MRTLLISPHNDDESLFCSHAISRWGADVLVVFDSYIQMARDAAKPFAEREYVSGVTPVELWPTAAVRRVETIKAYCILSEGFEKNRVGVLFAGLRDDLGTDAREVSQAVNSAVNLSDYDEVYAPAVETDGHKQHNVVALACAGMENLHCYLTYTRSGKSTNGNRVELSGEEARRKLAALACYRSQLHRADCRPHFLRDQTEYIL